jgi:hypothetical protein
MLSVAAALGFFLVLGGGIGCIPLVLLFVDYRRQPHKPVAYLAAFAISLTVLLPLLLRTAGLWLALAAPAAVLAYAALMRQLAVKRQAP